MAAAGKKEEPPAAATAAPPGGTTAAPPTPTTGTEMILDRYEIILGKKGFLGAGSFSTVQRGTDTKTGMPVAIKQFKMAEMKKDLATNVTKFKRQIDVLKFLMEPLKKEHIVDPMLRHEYFWSIDPKKCFLELVDYSKEADGTAGPDATDGSMYVITEIADYSLKDYLTERLNEKKPMSAKAVQLLCKSFLIAMGMLHAKGLAHLDMKPENIMRAGDTWKIIDVDGCTPLNKKVSINDSTISFSPCYCAPEWANFLIEEGEYCRIGHQLDVWSVGVSLCELVTLDAVLKPKYMQIFKNAGSHRKAGFMFLQWLADPSKALSMSKKVAEHSSQFTDLVLSRMLTKKPSERWSLAQCLRHDYMRSVEVPGLHIDIQDEHKEEKVHDPEHLGGRLSVDLKEKRLLRAQESTKDKPPLMKSILHKLHHDGDPGKTTDWQKRDVWLSADGSLCYFSPKTLKKLVLITHEQLAASRMSEVEVAGAVDVGEKQETKPGTTTPETSAETKTAEQQQGETNSSIVKSALPYTFVIDLDGGRYSATADDDHHALHQGLGDLGKMYFAAYSEKELKTWLEILDYARTHEDLAMQGQSGFIANAGLAKDFREWKILVRNRREKIERGTEQAYKPVYEAQIFKLSTDGDAHNEPDWLQRRMWLARNGALCYFSEKDQKELVYYRPEDIRFVKYRRMNLDESCKPYSFELALRATGDGQEYAPGVFAADTEEVMQIFLGCIEKYQRIKAEKEKAAGGGLARKL